MSVCCGSKPLGLGAAPFAAVGRRESVVSTWPCASLLRPCYSALSALHPPVGGRRAWHTVGSSSPLEAGDRLPIWKTGPEGPALCPWRGLLQDFKVSQTP